MAAGKKIEAFPIFLLSMVGLLYVAILVRPFDVVLLAIFILLVGRTVHAMIR